MPPKRHARLSASSSERWMHCPGSVRLSAGLPDYDTKYKLEGRAAHAIAEWRLTHADQQWVPYPHDMVLVDREDGNVEQWPVTEEMIEQVDLYVRTVVAARQEVMRDPDLGGWGLHIEQKLDLALLHPPEEMFGTGDAVLVVPGERLHIFDLKYGAGVVVEVENNPQLCFYVVGALLVELAREVWRPDSTFLVAETESMLQAALRLFPRITVTIVQPRAFHPQGPVRTVELSAEQIHRFAEELMERARATQDPSAPLVAGDWCRFCPAVAHCPVLAKHNQLVAVDDFTGVPVAEGPPDPARVTLAEAADLYTKGELLRAWLHALEVRITRALAQGEPVPGYKLVEKRPVRRWAADPTEALQQMGLVDEEIFARPLVRSPAQLERLIGRGRIPAPMVEKVSSGYKLAPESDPAPALVLSPADDFPDFPALPPAAADEPLNA